ncbi:MAG: efflux RND transporter periplasmic adaptor subunit [Caulobacteraceae bacterium]|nr:efflux RND transporter periplasmic adaptor subunit [Caulobacteraceae bacterium]
MLAVAALALAACGKAEQPENAQARARSVTVVRIAERPMSGSLSATGQLTPREEAAVAAEVGGYRVARVLVEQGAHVRAGQTLAVLDGTLLDAQIDQQAAIAAQADATADQAEAEARRVQGLDGQGVLSQEAIEQRRATAKAQRAAANAQAAGLRDLQTRRRKLSVTAPVSGLVLTRNVRPGDTSQVGGEPWFRMARDGLIELEAQLSQDDLDRVRVGQPARVTLPNGQVVDGEVRLVSPNVDPQTKLGAVRVRLPVRPDIRAGGFGHAEFKSQGTAVLTVPETAVRYDADGASVMTVTAQNRIKEVPVKTGDRGGGLVRILSGPPAGTRVVKSAAAFLLDNDLVRPVEEGAAAPAAKPAPSPAVKPAPSPAVK